MSSITRFSRVLAATAALTLGGVGAASAQAADKPAHDLAVSYTVSALKAEGAAGLVAIHVTNVGSERYFGEYPMINFQVKVQTVKGPQGVDRVITPTGFTGAHVRDLGFNEKSSTRTFEVSLSNALSPGQRMLVGNLSFGDGLTSEGRLVQKLVTTQTTRLEDDAPNANDQNVDSTVKPNTKSDFGSTSTVTGRF